MTKQLGEFELIQTYFSQAATDKTVALGIGDDCAILEVPQGYQLVLSTDTLVAGTHFLVNTPAQHLATRLLGSALSDLAAMGAEPAWLSLNLTLPEANAAWLKDFSVTLLQLAEAWGIHLIGGDTTRGPLTLSATVQGFVPSGQALCRTGAQPGDLICVTDCLGDSAAGLDSLIKQQAITPSIAYLQNKFYAPIPRLETGRALRQIASAVIDISDGLLADLIHLLTASAVGAEIQTDCLPLSKQLLETVELNQAQTWALAGGEDFELCFTLPTKYQDKLADLAEDISILGQITEKPGLCLDGKLVASQGYQHFKEDQTYE